jgi:soluble lytic murein transglycosylase-like protein
MEQSIKNLLLWLLTLATFLTMHANTVGEEQGHAQNAPMQPEDVRIEGVQLSAPEPSLTGSAVQDKVKSVSSSPLKTKKRNEPFRPIIIKVAGRYEVDPALVKAIIMAESGYNPRAVSKRGAKGLMQLMPNTAKALGVENIFDPEHNVNAGVKYFKGLLNRFGGDVELALAAYNAGSRKVRQYKGIPPFRSTKVYIKKVFKYYELYKEQT